MKKDDFKSKCKINKIRWKGPCYLITDAHYKTFKELMDNTD